MPFEIVPRGPFSLAESAAFLAGWPPAAAGGRRWDGHLHLAFVPDDGEGAAGVCLRQRSGAVVAELFGRAETDALRRQIERIFSLDGDGDAYLAIGRRDPVVATLQAQAPGFRPVNFPSPYEAAAWALISQRMRMTQAAAIKRRLADQLGEAVSIHGEVRPAFPSPTRLQKLDAVPGLTEQKIARLRALAHAALAGRLDAQRLRAMPPAQALTQLQILPGIGPFGAELILLRGAGAADVLPDNEPRVRRAAAQAYGLPHEPTPAEFATLAEAWRPFRTWVCVLLRRGLDLSAARPGARRSGATPGAPNHLDGALGCSAMSAAQVSAAP
jgi:DNA-3-methyladenine glycosylase II